VFPPNRQQAIPQIPGQQYAFINPSSKPAAPFTGKPFHSMSCGKAISASMQAGDCSSRRMVLLSRRLVFCETPGFA